MKTIERLIICVALILVAYSVCGCKDKAEGYEPGESYDITFDWAPEYPINIAFYDGDSAERATFEVVEDNEIICDSTREKWLRLVYHSMSGKEPNGPVTLRFEEPETSLTEGTVRWNDWFDKPELEIYIDDEWKSTSRTKEPEPNELCKHENRITCTVGGCGCWTCMDCPERSPPDRPETLYNFEVVPEPEVSVDIYNLLLKLIPTWPDYIKLEKDLLATYPNFEGHTVINLLPKGTKIYFKD